MRKHVWIGMIGLVLLVATQVGAQLYTQDFETNPGYTASDDHAVGAFGSTATYHAFGEWGGTADIGITQTGGALQIGSNTSGGSARNRGFTVTIDTSAAVPGVFVVSFDVSNFVAGTGSAGMAVHEGSGLDTLYALWDVGGNSSGDVWPRNLGTAPSAVIGDTGSLGTGITGNGTVSINVALTEAGVAGDYITLAFAQIRSTATAVAPTFDIDNVQVEASSGNFPPVANPQSVDVVQNTFLDITLTGSDPEGSNLTYAVDIPTSGTLSLVTNQTYTYTPGTDYLGLDSFTFTVNDGQQDSEPATVSISVNMQEPPVADAQGVSVEMNTFVDITLTGTDVETANSNLTYSVTDTTANGVLTGAANSWTYTPDTDYTGSDSFTFTVNDGETNSEPVTVSILVYEQSVVGATLYEEDFTVDPGYISIANSSTSIGAAGGAGTYFTFGQYNGTGDLNESTSNGVLHIDQVTNTRADRSRGLSVFIDTSAAVPGFYTVSFDVSNWVDGTTGTAGFKAFEGSGLDTGFVDVDNGDNASNGAVPKSASSSTATWIALNDTWGAGAGGTGISGNGIVSFEIELTEAGQAGDYLALAWVQVNLINDMAPTFDVDNVWVGVPPETYSSWARSFDLIGDDALEGSDVEPDGIDNLMEYALGGNPTIDDAAAVSPDTFMADDMNWFYHVYNQNTDPNLTFAVGSDADLVNAPSWDTGDVFFVGESSVVDGFKTVTNRTEAATAAKYIELKVTQ